MVDGKGELGLSGLRGGFCSFPADTLSYHGEIIKAVREMGQSVSGWLQCTTETIDLPELPLNAYRRADDVFVYIYSNTMTLMTFLSAALLEFLWRFDVFICSFKQCYDSLKTPLSVFIVIFQCFEDAFVCIYSNVSVL